MLVLGAVAAKLGLLDIWFVLLAAMAGSFAGDQFYFWIGRRYGPSMIERWPSWRMRVGRASRLLGVYDAWFILGFRFVYGLRSISPFVIGMSNVSAGRFLVLNFIAALVWATVIGGASYALGAVIETVLADIQHLKHYAIAIVAGGGILLWLAHLIRMRLRTRRFVEAETHEEK